MYSEGGWMMVFGVLLSLGFIALMVWYANVSIPKELNTLINKWKKNKEKIV